MDLQNVYKKIAEDMNYLFINMSNTLKFDKTFRAKVISKESNGKYKVLYKNKKYLAKCDGNLNIGDMVWVCAPKNDWSELYVQFGKALQNKISSINSNLEAIKSTPGLFNNYGSLVLNSQNASGIEGSELVFRGLGGNKGNNVTLDCYNNYFRVYGNFNDTKFHIYEFKADGIHLDYSKLPSNSDLALQTIYPFSAVPLENGFKYWNDSSFGAISRCGKNVHVNMLMQGNAGTIHSDICTLPFIPAKHEIHSTTLSDGTYVEYRTYSNGKLHFESSKIPTVAWWPIDLTYTCK